MMHCKPCEICAISHVCRQADEDGARCPVEDATEEDTVKTAYEEV